MKKITTRKISLLIGVVAGFIFGSRSGRGPYEKLAANVRSIKRRPDVQERFESIKGTAHEKVAMMANLAKDQVSSHDGPTDDNHDPEPSH